jgi:hypothetical protein
MKHRKGLQIAVVGMVVWLLAGLACNFSGSRPATPTPARSTIEEVDALPVAPTTTVPTVETLTPEDDADEPPTDSGSPVVGSIELEDGRCCAGGMAGETIQIAAVLSAESSGDQVTEMRFSTAGSGCRESPSLAGTAWEPFARQKEFPFRVAINWVGFNVWVQFRDDQGRLSALYCDDISVEGMPAPPPGS